MLKVLFFAPHAAIWVHAFPEALVAEALAQYGHSITYVTCGKSFRKYCIPMSAVGLTQDSPAAQKEQICKQCESSKNVLVRQFGFKSYSLESSLDAIDRQAIADLMSATTRENYLSLQVEGVPVGRYALYELLLSYKKGALSFSDNEWAGYLIALENSLLAIFAARRFLTSEAPDRVVSYNTLYSVNHVVHDLAERRGISTYFLHAGGSLSRQLETLLLGRRNGVAFYTDLLGHWPAVKNDPCEPKLLERVTDHCLELLRGRSAFAYSAPRAFDGIDLRTQFGIDAHAQILVATMSSPDERFAAETIGAMAGVRAELFGTQIEWIRQLLNFVANRPDLVLIIRVHPREFPNKRESVKSEHATVLQAEFSKLPPNAVVNWPEDGVSLYNLADIADVFLNAWSAAGKEMSLLGLPVVVYASELLAYPADLNFVASTEEDYFTKIDQALDEGWNIERSRSAFRWCALEYERSIIDVGESFPRATTRASFRRIFDRALSKVDRRLPMLRDCFFRTQRLRDAAIIADTIARNNSSPLALTAPSSSDVSLASETATLRVEVGRLVKALYGTVNLEPNAGVLQRRLVAFATNA